MTSAVPNGVHLIAELDGCRASVSQEAMACLLTAATEAAGAKMLSVHVHPFPGGGLAGVAVLAESHISVHTWPEFGYAAVDVFVCGLQVRPDAALAVLVSGLGAATVHTARVERTSRARPAR